MSERSGRCGSSRVSISSESAAVSDRGWDHFAVLRRKWLSRLTYNATGTTKTIEKSYPAGQGISRLTESYEYDDFSGIEIVSRTVSDAATTLISQSRWSEYGDRVETDELHLQGAMSFPTVSFAYDAAGRVIAAAASP